LLIGLVLLLLQGLSLLEHVWEKLKEQVVNILKQLELISAASFQISIGVGSTAAAAAFDKHRD
jgi:hypothetical protein